MYLYIETKNIDVVDTLNFREKHRSFFDVLTNFHKNKQKKTDDFWCETKL